MKIPGSYLQPLVIPEAVPEPEPDLSPPYYDQGGQLLTSYDAIREHQQEIVKTHVMEMVYGAHEGMARNNMTVQSMKQHAITLLGRSKAKGLIHPQSSIENWIAHDEDYLTDPHLRWSDKSCYKHEKKQGLYGWIAGPADWEREHKRQKKRDLEWNGHFFVPNRRRQIRDRFRRQLEPPIMSQAVRALHVNFKDPEQNELVALQLLRSMVDCAVFRRYLKYGFVTIEGPSGLVYQIQRKSHLITVRDKGEKLATLCVYLQDQTIPPTDEVIAKMLICECDEVDIWERANVQWHSLIFGKENTLQMLGVAA